MDKTWEIRDSALSYITHWSFLVCRLGTTCICNVCQGYWRHPLRKDTPRPLNGVRKRALTAPLPDHEEVIPSGDVLASMRRAGLKFQRKTHRAQRTFDQAQSSLFTRLPAEIRRLIYIELFVGDVPVVHIVRKNRQLSHLRCISNCTTRLTSLKVNCWNNLGCPTGDLISRHTALRTDGDIIPLLLACRRIYSEAIDLLYSSTTFLFLINDALIHLSLSILPQRLNAIRTLHLRWLVLFDNPSFRLDFQAWEKVCDVMALMRGLQILRIGVDVRPLAERKVTSFEVEERWFLEPLRKVTMVRDFEVTLWRVPRRTERYEMMDGAPFRLIDWMDEQYEMDGAPFRLMAGSDFDIHKMRK